MCHTELNLGQSFKENGSDGVGVGVTEGEQYKEHRIQRHLLAIQPWISHLIFLKTLVV